VPGSSPTVRQRELGRRLRLLRIEHHLTVEDVGARLLCSATKISRLETGARRPSLRDVRDLCNMYEVDESTSAELMSLARGAREQTWWTQYEDLNLNPYLGLEQDAVAITSCTTHLFPALLQTEVYARAVIKAIAPKMKPDIYQQRVKARMRRQQQVLEKRNSPRYLVFLDEAVLHRRVGDVSLMAAQLDKILDAISNDRVTVRVLPFDVGVHASQDSNFILFELEEPEQLDELGEGPGLSPVVFVEGLTGNQYLERENDIARYREAIELLSDSALSSPDSAEYIAKIKYQVHKTR
jgi:transcriptional regulator with XRE-family HTH domain